MLKNILKNHWLILIFASVIGVLIILPTIVSIYKIGPENFHGTYPILNDDEGHYLAMTREVSDGHPALGNVFLKENKNRPYVQPPLVERLMAETAEFSGLSIPALFFIGDFIFPFIGVMALYLLFFKTVGSRIGAAFLSFIFYFLFLFSFGRPVNPQLSFSLFTLGLILIWKIYKRKEGERIWPLLAALGFLAGFLVYLYPYFWTALAVLGGVSLAARGLSEKRISATVKDFSIFIFSLGVFSAPYLLNYAKASISPFYSETMARFGLLNTHWPACYINIFITFSAAVIVFLARKKITDEKELFFSYALLASAIILNWQNVITGKYLQFSSHYYQVTILFSLLALIIVLKSLPQELKGRGIGVSLKGAPLLFLLIILFSAGLIYKQTGEIKNGLRPIVRAQEIGELQKTADLFNWLNDNTAPDSVIYSLAGDNLTQYLPIYTKNNLYSYGYAGYYLMSGSEMEDRWVRQNLFNDKINAEYIFNHHREIWQNKFIDRYQNQVVRNKIIQALTGKKIAAPVLVPPEYVKRVLDKYKEVKKENLRSALRKYEIDYMLVDLSSNKDLATELEKHEFIQLITQIDNNLIYLVN